MIFVFCKIIFILFIAGRLLHVLILDLFHFDVLQMTRNLFNPGLFLHRSSQKSCGEVIFMVISNYSFF